MLYNQVLLGYIDSILQSQSGATTVKHGKHTAQDQTQCLLAAELVVRAQMKAQQVTLKS